MSKLPFEGRIFWKTLPVVYFLVVVAWVLIVRFTDYEMTPADYGGSFISSTILAYLVHLWLLPGEYASEELDDDEHEDQSESAEEGTAKEQPATKD